MSILLLDSARLDEIQRISHTNAISGVTTNPSLMAKTEGGDYIERLKLIAKVLGQGVLKKNVHRKHLSVEVITSDPNEMRSQAKKLAKELKAFEPWIDLYIKIPVTIDTLPIITHLEKGWNIKVNATACMMGSQAKLAAGAGASIISFFYNRMRDGGDTTPQYTIKEYSDSRKRTAVPGVFSYPLIPDPIVKPKIICGSIRKPEDIYQCWKAGAEYVTASMKIIELLMKHPQTDLAISQFQEDIDKWLEKKE